MFRCCKSCFCRSSRQYGRAADQADPVASTTSKAGKRTSAGATTACVVHAAVTHRLQTNLATFFRLVAKNVLKQPTWTILYCLGWINFTFLGVLIGRADLRIVESLLPNSARELKAQYLVHDRFGYEWGHSNVVVSASDNGDLLTSTRLNAIAIFEEQVQAITVTDPDDGRVISYGSTCEPFYFNPDGSAGPCFYRSLFGPKTDWNLDPPFKNTSAAFSEFKRYAAALEAQNPTASVDGYHLAASQLLSRVASGNDGDMFTFGILGGVTTGSKTFNTVRCPDPPGACVRTGKTAVEVTAIGAISHSFLMGGVPRSTLSFRIWDVITGAVAKLSDVEQWERAFLAWGQANAIWTASDGGGEQLVVRRIAKWSESVELMKILADSVWLLTTAAAIIVGSAALNISRKPSKKYFWPRLKLAMSGISSVLIAAATGILLVTMLQVPLNFATHFVVFVVLAIGLDGVYLFTDTFDSMDVSLSVDQRIATAMIHTGPSVLISSMVHIMSFLAAMIIPIPVVKQFCATCAVSLAIAFVLLFTWYAAWIKQIVANNERRQRNAILADAMMEHIPGNAMSGITYANPDYGRGAVTTGHDQIPIEFTKLVELVAQAKVDATTTVTMVGAGRKPIPLGDAVRLFVQKHGQMGDKGEDPIAWTPTPMQPTGFEIFWTTRIVPGLATLHVRIGVAIGTLCLVVITLIGLTKLSPGWGYADFVRGSGLTCDPSHMIAYDKNIKDQFEPASEPLTLVIDNLDINTGRASYNALMADLHGGSIEHSDSVLKSNNGTGKKCPISLLDDRFPVFSWYDDFCASRTCSSSTSHTAADLAQFFDADLKNRGYYKMVNLPDSVLLSSAAAVKSMRVILPMRQHSDTLDSVCALQAINDIADKSPLESHFYSERLPIYSMFAEISSTMITSLSVSLMLAFVVMLSAFGIKVALAILVLLMLTAANMAAAIYFVNDYLGPLTVFIPLIAVEICLDYHVHIAQKFLVSQGTTNARIQAATAVGKTVLKSGSTMLLGMASLLLAPGKAAYVFGILFSLSIFLGLYYALCVLPVVLSWIQSQPIQNDERKIG